MRWGARGEEGSKKRKGKSKGQRTKQGGGRKAEVAVQQDHRVFVNEV